ncbi:lipid II:glycine glycyltransferase (peptidoglycan interpeptide bridge formation enzyme) [Desulfomicrobium macestii]|uniref:Lipid II:glycine glycyltransferase (Peptidoglycan interpeptide bridge formation enzyme) n=1 Tax=Desulfomicrobium macestii TaxID=90731 RepID=A0ABR9H5C9_9BACT|nr:peptidoglycan bridge formation glycyltransferase FemA/FemB family protein [Desulfomicrobium macestii]MBE1425904.1 lipid II:glycine glycyltransferase (peptidoglycan interpeptide bridge formation enzyme) [Desulfomicrobium macestii]
MLDLSVKKPEALLPTDIFFQTPYWAQVKSRQGFKPLAFDLESRKCGDVLVLLQPLGDKKVAVVPQGPEYAPDEENYGPFLEDFSLALGKELGPEVAFIRYDLPWKSLYADEMRKREWTAFPEPRIREMRMNMGTRHWNIRKAFTDLTVASSLVVDLDGNDDALLARMKAKTRYNIGLAQRKGVTARTVSAENLPEFHALYCQTAQRNGFAPCSFENFAALFKCRLAARGNSELVFLLAGHGKDNLAGAIIGISGKAANFLYGASSNQKRGLMAPYLMHWTAMTLARDRGCLTYEMGAVSPGLDPAHPFHGMYRFKTGFGGRIELRSGSWDFPLDQDAYRSFCNAEGLTRYRSTQRAS